MEYRNDDIDELYATIVQLDNIEDCANLFEDMCTIKEIQDMALRLKTAKLLDQGANYAQISKEMGLSSTTIARVNHSLHYGSGGYRKIIDKNCKK